MKKTILILISFSFFTCIGYAQYDNGFRLGLKMSPAASWLKSNEKSASYDGIKPDFSYGLIAEIVLGDNYAFATGFEIMNNGGILDYSKAPYKVFFYEETGDTFYVTQRKYKVRYVNVPLTLKFKTNEIGHFSYFGIFGADAGVRIKAFTDNAGTINSSKAEAESNKNDALEDVNFLRLALNIGIGAEYNISGKTSLVTSLHFNNGFTNVLARNSRQLKYSANQKLRQNAINNYISLNIGILF